MLRKRSGVTLIELMAIAIIVSMVLGTLHRLVSGTFSNLFKSQTKFTNLRAASIILEHLKHDVRLAVIPADDSEKHSLSSSPGNLEFSFQIVDYDDGVTMSRKRVTYSYDGVFINRSVSGLADRKISQAKVSDFSIEEDKDNGMIKVLIEVDDELGEVDRSSNSLGNKVRLTAVLFPRFLSSFQDLSEEYWAKARLL